MRAWLGTSSVAIFVLYATSLLAWGPRAGKNGKYPMHITQVWEESSPDAAIAWAESVTYSIGNILTLTG